MSWKKSVFSYLIWVVYAVMLGMAMISLGRELCAEMGVGTWIGIPAAVLCLAAAGILVYLLHRTSASRRAFSERNKAMLLAFEAVLAAALFVTGVVLRVLAVSGASGTSEYFEMAAVVEGQRIPQIVHGAVHFYVRLLHGLFRLLGNQYMAGLGLQIALQLTSAVGLYFIVRRLAGAVSALVTFGFCMCAPYMLQAAMMLSPSMLFFLLLVGAAGAAMTLCRGELRLPAFALTGLLAAFCCYLDVSGFLILLLGFACAFSEREETGFGRRLSAAGICLAAAVCGFLVIIWADAFMSGKGFLKVVEAWFQLYRPQVFSVPFELGTAGTGGEEAVLFGLLAFGVFGFWRERGREYLSPYAAAVCIVLLAGCFGIFTEEMPGTFALYVLFTILAGVGIGQCFRFSAVQEGAVQKPRRQRVKRKQPEGEMSTEKILAQEARLWEVGFAMEAGEKAFFESDEEMPGSKPEASGDREDTVDLYKKEKELQQDFRQTETAGKQTREAGEDSREERKVRYLENPLPLPKKHVRRVLDYSIQVADGDDYDYPVKDTDDFDI